jgi:hypothetical protein
MCIGSNFSLIGTCLGLFYVYLQYSVVIY